MVFAAAAGFAAAETAGFFSDAVAAGFLEAVEVAVGFFAAADAAGFFAAVDAVVFFVAEEVAGFFTAEEAAGFFAVAISFLLLEFKYYTDDSGRENEENGVKLFHLFHTAGEKQQHSGEQNGFEIQSV